MTADLKPKVGSKNLLDVLTEGRILPEGTDTWVVRTVKPDFRSQQGFRWPFPGQWAEAPGPIVHENDSPCPVAVGDGICVATTWADMASGGVPARTLLLCAIKKDEALSPSSGDKIRVPRAFVVDVIDGERIIREQGTAADLRYADLRYADLRYANLRYANLSAANLRGADLYRADLRDANLSAANLYAANLYAANLYAADLYAADLRDATLYGADLRDADLYGADLRYADLRRADLYGANLDGADLRAADLSGANLRYADLSASQRARAKEQGARIS